MHQLNRRTFLGYSVAAGARPRAPIIPASVWGAEDAAARETVSVAFIGVGGMGRHNKDFLLQKDCRSRRGVRRVP